MAADSTLKELLSGPSRYVDIALLVGMAIWGYNVTIKLEDISKALEQVVASEQKIQMVETAMLDRLDRMEDELRDLRRAR